MNYSHKTVLLDEVLELLDPQKKDIIVDCTLGGGGHTEAILHKLGKKGKVVGIDLDVDALEAAQKRLTKFSKQVIYIHSNYTNIKEILYDEGLDNVDGVLLDLGVSSYEIEGSGRGFTFTGSQPLDMRFSPGTQDLTAADILRTYKEGELVRIFSEYGEEWRSKSIAKAIIEFRKTEKIETTDQLVGIIKKVYSKGKTPRSIHQATKVFQALRIEVNDEIEGLKAFLRDVIDILKPGGRITVISFHSGEDRIVKDFFKTYSRDNYQSQIFTDVPKEHSKKLRLLTKKPVVASRDEIDSNPRSRSAKLRGAEKL